MAHRAPVVYVIEPDLTLSSLLEEILADDGYTVRCFADELPSDEEVARDAPALAVIAFPLGQPSGRTSMPAIKRLRDAMAPAPLPVIGLTGDYEQLRKAETWFGELPQFALLGKPFGLDELLDVAHAVRHLGCSKPETVLQAEPGVLVADGRGQYLDANRLALSMLGYQLDELRGMGVGAVMTTGSDGAETEWSRYVGERSWSAKAVRLRKKDGSLVEVVIHANVLQGNVGDEPLYVAWLRA